MDFTVNGGQIGQRLKESKTHLANAHGARAVPGRSGSAGQDGFGAFVRGSPGERTATGDRSRSDHAGPQDSALGIPAARRKVAGMNSAVANALNEVTLGVTDLLLTGRAASCAEAEALYLDEHLEEVAALARAPLTDAEFRQHPLILLLMSHGSRGWEDSLGDGHAAKNPR